MPKLSDFPMITESSFSQTCFSFLLQASGMALSQQVLLQTNELPHEVQVQSFPLAHFPPCPLLTNQLQLLSLSTKQLFVHRQLTHSSTKPGYIFCGKKPQNCIYNILYIVRYRINVFIFFQKVMSLLSRNSESTFSGRNIRSRRLLTYKLEFDELLIQLAVKHKNRTGRNDPKGSFPGCVPNYVMHSVNLALTILAFSPIQGGPIASQSLPVCK